MLPSYAVLGGKFCPFSVEAVLRGIGRVFAGSRTLRTTKGIGAEASAEDGVTMAGGHIEHYVPAESRDWSRALAMRVDASLAQFPEGFQRRASACVEALLGSNGNAPVSELLVWIDPSQPSPQRWALLTASACGITVHDLADRTVLETWSAWVRQHATNDLPRT